MFPLVSVITPTWQRHSSLLSHAIPSVLKQNYLNAEHVVVSDGPDEFLRNFKFPPGVRYAELPEHAADRHWGHYARTRGIELALGEFIAYLDDDDDWEPNHLEVLVSALTNYPEAGFAYTRALVDTSTGQVRIGDGLPAHGCVQSSMLMHRRSVLDVAHWSAADPAEDWRLISNWLRAGISYESVGEVTVLHHPSVPIDNCVLVRRTPDWY